MLEDKKFDFSNNYLLFLIFVKILLTFFYLNIYENFSTIGDARGYLKRYLVFDFNAYYPLIFTNRQYFVETIYAISNTFFSNYLTPYIFSTISILIIWNVCKFYFVTTNIKNIFFFLLIFFSPSFALWTSVPSKEIITITLFIYLISCAVKIIFNERINILLFVISALIVAYVRPNYFIPYFFFILVVFIKIFILDKFTNKYYIKFSFGIYFIAFTIFILLILFNIIYFHDYLTNIINFIVYKSYSMFYVFEHMSSSMRNEYMEWNDYNDFYKNILFGSITAFSGPTLSEVINRPIFGVFFIESLILNLIMLYLFFSLLNLKNIISNFYFLYLFGFLFCFCLALLIHYPLGIFNLGSSLRYKQNIIPLMFFLPYMMLKYKYKYC